MLLKSNEGETRRIQIKATATETPPLTKRELSSEEAESLQVMAAVYFRTAEDMHKKAQPIPVQFRDGNTIQTTELTVDSLPKQLDEIVRVSFIESRTFTNNFDTVAEAFPNAFVFPGTDINEMRTAFVQLFDNKLQVSCPPESILQSIPSDTTIREFFLRKLLPTIIDQATERGKIPPVMHPSNREYALAWGRYFSRILGLFIYSIINHATIDFQSILNQSLDFAALKVVDTLATKPADVSFPFGVSEGDA